MANTEKVYSKERFEQLTREVNLLKNVEIPEVEEKLQQAYEMLVKVEQDKRMAEAKARYIKQITFYTDLKEMMEKELKQYAEEHLDYMVQAMNYPVR